MSPAIVFSPRLRMGPPRLCRLVWWVVAVGTALLCGLPVRAQLGITEVMAWASIECSGCEGTGNRGCRPDFWEVTNFGRTNIDLNGYLYADKSQSFPGEHWRIDRSVVVEPNKSVIFMREGWGMTSNAPMFRSWWGTNLSDDVQVICCYPGPGLDELGDGVRLIDPALNLVDEVYFGESRRGFTFAYDTSTGVALPSEKGVGGAFEAAACKDVGSPGRHSGPVKLQITQQPVSQTNEPGSQVIFSVRAQGLPRPRFQWYFNGVAMPTSPVSSPPILVLFAGCGPGWLENPPPSDLTIDNVQPHHAGEYRVEVFNGLEKLTSAVVRLTVNTTPLPLRVVCPYPIACQPDGSSFDPPSLTATSGQTNTFKVMVRGYPAPTFQWSRSTDGTSFTAIPRATNSTLEIQDVQASDAGYYQVRLESPSFATNLLVRLFVRPKAHLKITEAMSAPCFPEANDWWELTNLGNESVNLCGYRWDDGPGNIGGGPTVTNDVVVRPGESVIFLEGRTREFFMNWWGANNLPPGLQLITHTANGLEPSGDELNIWNPTARDDRDLVDSNSFSTARLGASFWFDSFECFDEIGVPYDTTSQVGQCGAFHSAQGCDVGSPGWTQWTPPQFTSVRRQGNQVHLEWKAQPGSTNVVEYTSGLAISPGPSGWTSLSPLSFVGATGTTNDIIPAGAPQRFYRIKRQAPAACPCPQ